MKVPYLNLEKSYSQIRPELTRAFLKVLSNGNVILGDEVVSFEREYAKFSSTKYCIGVGNGLDALTISLLSLGVKEGDEVVVPSNTYIATLIAASRIGAVPVLVEPFIDTYNINPLEIEKKITKRTRVIIPVHLFGQVSQMDKVIELSKKFNLLVVEDNAQSHGAMYDGKFAGSFGHANATSFYPGKNLGGIGDGGAITTSSLTVANKSRLYRNYGSHKKYFNEVIGFNSRLDELQAAFLRVRLKQLKKINNKKTKIAEIYLKELKEIGDIVLPHTEKRSTHVYHVFNIRTKKRDKLQKFLESKNITTLIHYPIPPHLQKAYNFLNYKGGDFPIAEELARTSLSLPIYPEMTQNEIEYVIENIRKFYKRI